jgi:DNA repair protein RecN (Recombination protein N)
MQLVSGHAQVLCVTHLAVIAAFAKRHFLVKKSVVAGETESVTHCLNAVQQTEEVARMLGGLKVTKSVRAAAREMLRAAKQDAA